MDDYGNTITPETLQSINTKFNEGEVRMAAIEAEQGAMRRELETNTAATQRVEANTKEMVEFFDAMKGAFRVLNWIGNLAKPVGAIATATGAVWAIYLAWRGHR